MTLFRASLTIWLPLLATTPPSESYGAEPPTITVKLLNGSSAGARDLADLARNATAVFRHAGIEPVWVTGPVTHTGDSVAGNVFWVRIVDRLDRGASHTLGWTSPQSATVTIQYRRAALLAKASAIIVTPGQILGHVAAHEIGHLLLRSSDHELFGLIKASYGKNDILAMTQGLLRFTPGEERQLRHNLSTQEVASDFDKAR